MLAPFTARTWRLAANILASLVIGACFSVAMVLALVVLGATSWIVGLGVITRAGTLRLAATMAGFDRGRIARFPDVRIDIAAHPPIAPGSSFRERARAWSRARWLWRLVAYQLIRLPAAAAAMFVAVFWWWAIIACWVLAGVGHGPVLLLGWQLDPGHINAGATAALVLLGAAGVLTWPLPVRIWSMLDVALAGTLLGPSHSERLAAELAQVSRARALAVQSADNERRRIERDLHDGLQPRLVALALDLGLVKARMDRDPDEARSLVGRAHEQAKRAVEDLRGLVRGIHPAILDERGLDAALSALVASCAVPVTVTVDLPTSTEPAREAVAYFAVAEAITNVTKHAQASKAAVEVSERGGSLRVVIDDDGRGGAELEPGGGLAGLADRVASLDGTLTVSSPVGGPTRIEVVIPCVP